MSVPTLTVVEGNASSAAAATAEAVNKVLTPLEKQISKHAKNFKFFNQDISALAEAIKDHVKDLSPRQLDEALANMFSRASKKMHESGVRAHPAALQATAEDFLSVLESAKKGFTARVEDSAAMKRLYANVENAKTKDAARAAANAHKKTPAWNDFAAMEKVNAAMWGAGALLSGFGLINAASGVMARDDEGKLNVRWSQLGVTLLQGVMTAGCAYMGLAAIRGAAR